MSAAMWNDYTVYSCLIGHLVVLNLLESLSVFSTFVGFFCVIEIFLCGEILIQCQ